eukprot:724074-Hanusia_phi.AAC.1
MGSQDARRDCRKDMTRGSRQERAVPNLITSLDGVSITGKVYRYLLPSSSSSSSSFSSPPLLLLLFVLVVSLCRTQISRSENITQ